MFQHFFRSYPVFKEQVVFTDVSETECNLSKRHSHKMFGGAKEDRTPDLLLARQALSQLSYGPINTLNIGNGGP